MNKAEPDIDVDQEREREKRAAKAAKLVAKKAAAREAQNQLHKDHLARERAFSDATEKKFFEGWEALCVQVRSEQMVEELRQQQRCFGTVVDRKNGCIDRLLAVRDERGETHDKCLGRLRCIIDYYVRLKDFLTAATLQRYEADCLELLVAFREEAAAKEDYGASQMELLDASLAELLDKMKRDEAAGADWLLENNDVNKSAQMEKCEILRDKKYAEADALYRQLRVTLDAYFQTVLYPERKTSYERLVYYTQLEQEAIEKRRCQIAVAQLKKSQLEHTTALARIGGRRKLRTLRNYRRLLELKVNLLKGQHQQLDEDHRALLRHVCSTTHRLKELLEDHFAWGEKIAKQGAICWQYETEQDEQFAAKWFRECADQSDDRFYDHLMNKINRVDAINIILREERIVLRRENDALKAKFKTFCGLQTAAHPPEKLLLCGQAVTLEP